MKVSNYTIPRVVVASWVMLNPADTTSSAAPKANHPQKKPFDIFKPLRRLLDNLEVKDAKFAHWLCTMIPAQCPFERDVKLFGHTLFHIPPMCKLNPLYDEVVGLRFRALCYLADECKEDISCYC
ncbi:Mo-dependent nitrogenase C-terminal domain-containing protein [Ancylothrix sp. C2]|uniref:Mo-dependent nitrogenase C-terminal domain-containing protein n=1 Tax=Ancylothrix sp. D3o TaxID=2953691 RepID=UPI0021BBA744|nr:Mo-dependent nitrogenase C-terminal domain-containing protein [Ancylothrix sp. D3o]MCT7949043.1 Mo-dependent nitrogenase C-terminal domain-containing protein [Ancylothrix sp. D3o]